MSGSHSLTAFEPTEYEAIEATMNDSARGRWFLAEYARRNRSADTGVLLDAIARLETVVTDGQGPESVGHFRGDLMDMANAISRTKAEIAAITDPDHDQTRLSIASEALDAIVQATERATTDILVAAEEVQENAWMLRERGLDAAVCDALDRHATQIYTACSFQDLTAQRTSRIVHTLRYLEQRLSAMISIWGREDASDPAGARIRDLAAGPRIAARRPLSERCRPVPRHGGPGGGRRDAGRVACDQARRGAVARRYRVPAGGAPIRNRSTWTSGEIGIETFEVGLSRSHGGRCRRWRRG